MAGEEQNWGYGRINPSRGIMQVANNIEKKEIQASDNRKAPEGPLDLDQIHDNRQKSVDLSGKSRINNPNLSFDKKPMGLLRRGESVGANIEGSLQLGAKKNRSSYELNENLKSGPFISQTDLAIPDGIEDQTNPGNPDSAISDGNQGDEVAEWTRVDPKYGLNQTQQRRSRAGKSNLLGGNILAVTGQQQPQSISWSHRRKYNQKHTHWKEIKLGII